MELSNWRLEGYRSIASGEFSPSEFDVFIGENNSGKSNIINSLLDYRTIVRQGVREQEWVENRVTARDSHNSITVEAEYNLSESESREILENLVNVFQEDLERLSDDIFRMVRHEIVLETFGRLKSKISIKTESGMVVVYDYVNSNSISEPKYRILDFSRWPEEEKYLSNGESLGDFKTENADDAMKNEEYFQFSTDHSHCVHRIFNNIINYIERWECVNAFRKVDRRQNIHIDSKLAADGRNLSKVLTTLRLNDPQKFDKISEIYQEVMSGISGIRAELIGEKESPDVTVSVREEAFERSFSLESISSGSEEILMLITKLVLVEDMATLLLVEEPELHLHPKAQYKILELLCNLHERKELQIVVSTHSDVFIDGTQNTRTIAVTRDGETQLQSVNGSDLNEHLLAMGFDSGAVLQSNGIVFVEDRSDQKILETFAEKMGSPFDKHSITIYRSKGDELFDYGEKILDLLQSLSIDYRIIVDSDGMKQDEKRDEVYEKIDGVNPEYIRVLSREEIESYLADNPEAIASILNTDVVPTDEVEEFLDGENKNKGSLSRLWREFTDSSYNEEVHGELIARHICEEDIPGEIRSLIRDVQSMTST